MKKIIFSSLLLMLLPFLASAQFGYGKISEIEAAQSRKLIIILEEPNDKVLKKLEKKKKSDRVDMYKAAVAQYNSNMKMVADKFWKFSKSGIEYMTLKQAEALKKAGNKDYSVLYCVSSAMSNTSSGFNDGDGLNWTWDIQDQSKDNEYFEGFTEMKISTLEDLDKKPIFYVVLTDIFPTTTSLVNGISTLQTYMDTRLRSKRDKEDISALELMKQWVEKNNKELKNKTLLIREDLLAKGYDHNKVAETYPYKFEIVNSAKLDSVVYAQDSRYVYALVAPGVNSGTKSNQVWYMQTIVGADNNEFYAYVMPGMGGAMLNPFGGHIGHRYIDDKVLKEFVNQK